ncbi:MAG TPA: hypothetical protein VEJ00_01460, partial [Candidatus Acidoferrales bacterium]|nr:hypothetical protein [Candidatus Acidoferrales bacterium]
DGDAGSPDEKALREVLALSVERASIHNVVFQGSGQPAGGLLPDWMSGYGFVFPTEPDLKRARHDREAVHNAPAWTLGYDDSDPLARLIAERVALNAHDAGLAVQPTATAKTGLRLVRIPLVSADPWVALAEAEGAAGLPAAKSKGGSAEDLYAAEQAELATQRIIPLLHLPVSYAAASSVKNWSLRPDGSWNLGDAWLGSGKP